MAFAWLVSFAVVAYLFGPRWGVPAFVFGYCMVCVRRFIPSSVSHLVFSIVAAALMWFATYEILKVTHVLYTPIIRL